MISYKRKSAVVALLLCIGCFGGNLFAQEEATTSGTIETTTSQSTEGSTSVVKEPTADPILKVEEDWVLVVRNPEAEAALPKVLNTISAFPRLLIPYAIFELNHSSMPEFNNGGMQIQGWYGQNAYYYKNGSKFNTLAIPDETIKYTLRMEAEPDAGKLHYEVTNGDSQSWGKFGGQGLLKLSLPSLLVTKLNYYTPLTSIKNAEVTEGAHNVSAFYLNEVRYYTKDGLFKTDNTRRYLHQYVAEVTSDISSISIDAERIKLDSGDLNLTIE